MRISDESSDVCSSDLRKTLGDAAEEVHEGAVEKGIALAERRDVAARREMAADLHRRAIVDLLRGKALGHHRNAQHDRRQIGRAPRRERVCHYVKISVVDVTLKKNK